MNLKGKLLAVSLMTTLGCVVLRDTSSQWKDDNIAVHHPAGPGTSDCSFQRIEHNLYSCDSGRRTSIGLFPGMWDPPTTSAGVPKDWSSFVSWSIVENIFGLCVPTAASMMYGPFPMSENSSITRGGLFGVHRWRERRLERIAKREKSEEVVVRDVSRSGSRCFRGKGIAGQDGVQLYVGYPGYDVISAEVTNRGAVDVLHDSFDRIRRFRKGIIDGASIAYEDRDVDDDVRVKSYLAFRKQCTDLNARALAISKKYKKYNCDEKLSFVETDVGNLLEEESAISPRFEGLVARVNAVEDAFNNQETDAHLNMSKAEDALQKGDWKNCRQIVETFYPKACEEERKFLSRLVARCDDLQGESEIKKMRLAVNSGLAKSPDDFEAIWKMVSDWPRTGSSTVQDRIKKAKEESATKIVNEQVAVLKRHLMEALTQKGVEDVLVKEYKNKRWLYDYSQANETVLKEIETCAQDRKEGIYQEFCTKLSTQLGELSRDDVLERLCTMAVPEKDLSEIKSLYELLALNADDLWQRRNEIVSRCTKTNKIGGMLISGGGTYDSYQIEKENPIVQRLLVQSVEKLCTIIPSHVGVITSETELRPMRSLIVGSANYLDRGLAKSALDAVADKMTELDVVEKQVAEEKRLAEEKRRVAELEAEVKTSKEDLAAARHEIELNPVRAKRNFKPIRVMLKITVVGVRENPHYKDADELERELSVRFSGEATKEFASAYSEMDAFSQELVTNTELGQLITLGAINELNKSVAEMAKEQAPIISVRNGHKYYVIAKSDENKTLDVYFMPRFSAETLLSLNKGDEVYVTGYVDDAKEIDSIVRRCDWIKRMK